MFLKELSDYSLQGLKVFAYVASFRSVAEAAHALKITQPAVSLQIHNLEKQLGFALFERQGRRNMLTSKGQSFLEKILPQLERLEQTLSEMRDIDTIQRPKLELGAIEGIGEFWFASRFSEFANEFENELRLFLEIADNSVLKEHLLTGRVSIILLAQKMEHPQVVSQLLMEEKLVPVGSAKSIEALKVALDKAKPGDRVWQDFNWIGYGDTAVTEQWAIKWLENIGVAVDRRLRFTHKVNSFSVIKRLLMEGRGICVAPLHSCEQELRDKSLVALESKKHPALKNVVYVSHRENSLNKIHETFLEWILKVAKGSAVQKEPLKT